MHIEAYGLTRLFVCARATDIRNCGGFGDHWHDTSLLAAYTLQEAQRRGLRRRDARLRQLGPVCDCRLSPEKVLARAVCSALGVLIHWVFHSVGWVRVTHYVCVSIRHVAATYRAHSGSRCALSTEDVDSRLPTATKEIHVRQRVPRIYKLTESGPLTRQEETGSGMGGKATKARVFT